MAKQRDCDKIEIYSIQVRGRLDQRWADWFSDFKMVYIDKDTILTGSVMDQAALHGVLAKIRDLGLTLLLVERLKCEGENGEDS